MDVTGRSLRWDGFRLCLCNSPSQGLAGRVIATLFELLLSIVERALRAGGKDGGLVGGRLRVGKGSERHRAHGLGRPHDGVRVGIVTPNAASSCAPEPAC